MDILGIGPLELFFIILIALIVLGPKDMVKAGRTIGKLLRKLVMSENWRTIQRASREIRTLPNRLIREAGIDEIQNDIKQTAEEISTAVPKPFDPAAIEPWKFNLAEWTTAPNQIAPPPEQSEAAVEAPASQDPATGDPN